MDSRSAGQKAWNDCMIQLRTRVAEADYKSWFEPLRGLSLDDNLVLTVELPSMYFVERLEQNYRDALTQALRAAVGEHARLRWSVLTAGQEQKMDQRQERQAINSGFQLPAQGPTGIFKVPDTKPQQVDPQLNADYTFATYVVGESNKMAASVGEAVAAAPGQTAFNPLFIHGGPGVGKTHLVQAIGARAKQLFANMTVTYLSADRFMRQFMDAKGANEINGFMRFYQGIGMLLLDDVQELSGRTGTADAFFQIFNHLLQNGRQVVLASDKKPTDLVGLHERLLSRFKSGMVVEVDAPDLETRLRIVKAKASAEGLSIPEDVAAYVAETVSGNARELQGAMVSLLAYATMKSSDLTLELAQKVVGDLVLRSKKEVLSKETIIKTVCDYFRLDEELLQKNTRKREVVVARQIAMFLCKKRTTDSLATIGLYLGNRNHSTVVYACRAIEGLMDTDPKVAEAVKAIEKMLA